MASPSKQRMLTKEKARRQRESKCFAFDVRGVDCFFLGSCKQQVHTAAKKETGRCLLGLLVLFLVLVLVLAAWFLLEHR
jgi:hypothetical protein